MATLQARLMLMAFVALTAAITYNATYLQKGPHPAPIAAEPQTGDRVIASGSQDGRNFTKTLPRHAATPPALPQSKTIITIQKKLAENGYNPGPADGVQGKLTRAAIMAYQYDNGLQVNGVASAQLLKNMILGASLGDETPDKSVPPPEETKALVKAVQLTLSKLGYDPGPADGLWGSATRKSIEKFERARKLDVKGRISGQLVKELMLANGGKLSDRGSS